MISVIIYDSIQDEMAYIFRAIKDIIAIKSQEKSHIDACCIQSELFELTENSDIEDFACIDICEENGMDIAADIRRRYPGIQMLLIADASISPERYIIPSIMASALIVRPCTRENIRHRLEDFMSPALEEFHAAEDDIFIFETKEGITKIPYGKIYFFESSRKKIYIRLKSEEYSYYDTLEQLMENLPGNFVRCHRSFIVNKIRVVRYVAAENLIWLDDGTEIPVSRSYRNDIRDMVK